MSDPYPGPPVPPPPTGGHQPGPSPLAQQQYPQQYPQPEPQLYRRRSKGWIVVAVLVGLFIVGSIAGGARDDDRPGSSSGPAAPAGPSDQQAPTTGERVDITAKYQEWYRNNVTIRGNDQWEPALNHVTAVEFDETTRSYGILTGLPAEDLRHPLPGMLLEAGSPICVSIGLYDSADGDVTVYGNDNEAAFGKSGEYGICQVVT